MLMLEKYCLINGMANLKSHKDRAKFVKTLVEYLMLTSSKTYQNRNRQ